jgi:hypothetical protein
MRNGDPKLDSRAAVTGPAATAVFARHDFADADNKTAKQLREV